MNAIRDGYTRYTPNAGTLELRQAICHKLKGYFRIQIFACLCVLFMIILGEVGSLTMWQNCFCRREWNYTFSWSDCCQ